MPQKELTSPEYVLCGDPGDVTQRRYNYQNVYAAIVSLALIYQEDKYESVFCEHHEDILLKKRNGNFEGIQVKTRELHLGPFKSTDESIINSISRFIQHEIEHPDQFDAYVIAVNCSYWTQKDNHHNLRHLLDIAKKAKDDPSALNDPTLLRYVRLLKHPVGVVVKVLSKLYLEDQLPRLQDIELRLVYALRDVEGIGDPHYSQLYDAANELSVLTSRAASLGNDSPLFDYIPLLDNPKDEKTRLIINGKKITKDQLRGIVKSCCSKPILLKSHNYIPIAKLPKGMKKMELKMAAGGVSSKKIGLMKDWKISADTLVTEWFHKDQEEANKSYDHIRTIINTESQFAHDSVEKTDELYGIPMFSEVRRRIEKRYDQESKEVLLGCLKEQLLGFVGLITEECTLWWSSEFEIPEEV